MVGVDVVPTERATSNFYVWGQANVSFLCVKMKLN